MENTNERNVKVLVADPSALGLFGLAIITLVASSQKLGLTSGVSLVLPWAIFLGASAQLVACINDFKHNNVFGATAFGAYAFFWYAMGFSWMIQNGVFGEKLAASVDTTQLGVAFLGLSLSSFGIATELTHGIAAWSELAIAILSFYGCAGNVLNGHLKKVILPLGKPFGILK